MNTKGAMELYAEKLEDYEGEIPQIKRMFIRYTLMCWIRYV